MDPSRANGHRPFVIVDNETAFCPEISPTALRVWIALASHADADGWCWPSEYRLAFLADRTTRTVRRALRELELAGLVTQTIRGRGQTALYRVHAYPQITIANETIAK